jgi:hypothetical protein
VFIAVSGGVRTTVGGFRISARSPLPIAMLGLVAFSIWLFAARKQAAVSTDLDAIWSWVDRRATPLIVAVAIASASVAAVFSTRSASGADASGYLSQAAAWTMQSPPPIHTELLAQEVPELGGWSSTPLGWRPAGRTDEGPGSAQVPTYPPGLPLLMALPHALAGINGAAAVVIASAAVAVIATGAVAASLAGGIAGLIAASLIAFTPVFLYQAVQPMSDVPVTAAWLACFALLVRSTPRDLPAGIACALAVLIRPNLAPLAVVPWLLARRRTRFAVPVAVSGMCLAFAQWFWYGSALQSGYGSATELFSLSNIVPNASRYARWFVATAPALLIGAIALVRLRHNRNAAGMSVFAGLVIAAYLIYAVFDDWSYLRFLLPALAVFAAFAGIELAAWLSRRPAVIRAPLLYVLLIGVTAHSVLLARTFDTFRLAEQLRRVAGVAGFLHTTAPPGAVLVAGEQSGSMRYYTQRRIIRWEAAAPDAVAAAIRQLDPQQHPIYVVLDAWEEPLFRARYASLPAVALDWPPLLEAGRTHRTRVWRLADRDRFLKGEPLDIKRLP